MKDQRWKAYYIQMPHAHGRQAKVMVGLSCECGIYWDLKYPVDSLYAKAVRWTCDVCSSSKQICKFAPPISKCYRGDAMMIAHLKNKSLD